MSDTSRSTSGGVGFAGLLTIVFVTLKLIGEHFHTAVADWSWWWVFSPLWLPLAVMLVGAAVVLGVGLAFTWTIDKWDARKARIRREERQRRAAAARM